MKKCVWLAVSVLCVTAVVSGCGGGGGTSKLDLCYKVAGAYCQRAAQLGCSGAGSCLPDNQAACDEGIPNDCAASQDQIEESDHIIEMWIRTKQTCDSLESLDGALLQSMSDLEASECAGGDPTGGETVGKLCRQVLDAVCTKIRNLGCTGLSQDECRSGLFSAGTVALDGYACRDGEAATAATAGQKAARDQWLSATAAASDCAEFGF